MDVEMGDFSSVYGHMNIHTNLKHNGLELLINDNDRIYTDMNDTLQNVDMISWTGLLKSNTIPLYNEWSQLNHMNMSVDNGDVNDNYCYMSGCTVYESKNHNPIEYNNKRDEISSNIYLRGNNGLPDGVCIDVILTPSALDQYVNIEYNNEYHNLHSNGNIST